MKNIAKILIAKLLLVILAVSINASANAQDGKFRDQAWRYGLMGAFQHNTASLGWQTLHGSNANFHSAPDNIDRVDGTGRGIYGGIFGSYLSESWWGIQMKISYDERNALVNDDTRLPIPSFDTKMSYLSFAPSIRIDQNLIPNLNFHFGPFLNANLSGEYYYKADKDQANAD